ncbi:MAG: hypothetical protein GY796_12625 [Chloroflexi bacterium]|nr:hypothetical protein [Chloroflexota bacterium]
MQFSSLSLQGINPFNQLRTQLIKFLVCVLVSIFNPLDFHHPLLLKRIAIKKQLSPMNRRDCRYRNLKARADALKWLLVVCFGYLGYKNARFGRIESHEAVTAYGREALLRAKEAAEDLGFTVLHMYVDGIWVQQAGYKQPADFAPLQAEILARTQLKQMWSTLIHLSILILVFTTGCPSTSGRTPLSNCCNPIRINHS